MITNEIKIKLGIYKLDLKKIDCIETFEKKVAGIYFAFTKAGIIEYIGTSICIKKRILSHEKRISNSNLFYIEITKDRYKLENKLIKLFSPLLNIKTGRKGIKDKEKITLVKCWVKAKHVVKVQKEIAAIEKKYNCT
jgi:hypothetical protein